MVGLPRESKTWQAEMEVIFISRSKLRQPAEPRSRQYRGREKFPAGSCSRTNSRTNCCRAASRYSTGDLPSTRASISINSNRPTRNSISGCFRPHRLIRRPEFVEHRPHADLARRVPKRLQGKMGQQKGEVECRVAIPGDFAIQHHQTVAVDQNVFRAEIAMHQAFAGGRQPCGFGLKQRTQRRMFCAGGQQKGFDPQLKKNRCGIEQTHGLGIAGRMPVNLRQHISRVTGRGPPPPDRPAAFVSSSRKRPFKYSIVK